MGWIIASVPFWLLGLLFLVGALCAIPLRESHETMADLTGQVIGSLIACGIALTLAAKLIS